jgi:hypothetical protein
MERENNLLSCDELDAVVGGMMNNGQGDRLQTPNNTGGPGAGMADFVRGLLVGAAAVTILASL